LWTVGIAVREAQNAWFWSRVAEPDENGCRIWTGAVDQDGYGHVAFGICTYRANRVAMILHYGSIPAGQHACHSCDNPACCEPSHLWSGSNRENSLDAQAKGRLRSRPVSGASNPNAKLSEDQARRIIALIEDGGTNTAIARRFGVTHSNVSAIRRGKSWAQIPRTLARSES